MHPASTNITDKLINGTCVDIRNDIVRSGNKIIEKKRREESPENYFKL
jgi:hypothetical protein